METKIKVDVLVRYIQDENGVWKHLGYKADVEVFNTSSSTAWRMGRFTVKAHKGDDLIQLVLDGVEQVCKSYKELARKREHIERSLQDVLEEQYAEAEVRAYLHKVSEE